MYDFYFGTKEQIEADPKFFLLTVKRMLPRWLNGIPDSEFLAIYDMLEGIENEYPELIRKGHVLAETGSGTSTIVMLYFALRWDTELFTWDISSNKLAYLRGLLTDTLFRHFRDKNIFNHWKYVAFDSKSPNVGIPILKELGRKVVYGFLDSDHTWVNLCAEVEALCPVMAENAILAIDDGNYRYDKVNTAYMNMLRTKLGLDSARIENNDCRTFQEEVQQLLQKHFKTVVNLEGGSYRQSFQEDIFWAYYSADRQNMADLGMEKLDELAHRFDAWRVLIGNIGE